MLPRAEEARAERRSGPPHGRSVVIRRWGIRLAGFALVLLIGAVSLAPVLWERETQARVAELLVDFPIPDNRLTPDPALVVTNPAPDPASPSFVIAPDPVMTVGLDRGDPALLAADPDEDLWSVHDAALTPTGELVLINPSDEVRIFDPRGEHLRTLKGRGEGPADINRVRQLATLDDGSIVLWDETVQRIVRFDLDGTPLSHTIAAIRALCCLADGSFLHRPTAPTITLATPDGPLTRPQPRMGARALVPEILVWHHAPGDPGPAHSDSILVLEGEDPRFELGGGFTGSTSWHERPFSREGQVVLAGDRVIYGRGDSYEFRTYSTRGELLQVVKTEADAVPVTDRDIALERPLWTRRGGDNRRRRRIYTRQYDDLDHPATMPAYGRIEADENGWVWVERHEPDAQERPQWWAGFDRDGVLQGTLSIPDGFTVVAFSRGHAIIREPIGEFGFVGLRVHLIEPASPSGTSPR